MYGNPQRPADAWSGWISEEPIPNPIDPFDMQPFTALLEPPAMSRMRPMRRSRSKSKPSLTDTSIYVSLDCEMIGTTTAAERERHRLGKIEWQRAKAEEEAKRQEEKDNPPPCPAEDAGGAAGPDDGTKAKKDSSKQVKKRYVTPQTNTLARVSIVDWDLNVLLDVYVQPPKDHVVIDYRTWVSGIRPEHTLAENGAITFSEARNLVKKVIQGRWMVGHTLQGDLAALHMNQTPGRYVAGIIDLAKMHVYRTPETKNVPGLRKLSKRYLDYDMIGTMDRNPSRQARNDAYMGKTQTGHSSVEDAVVTMRLFKLEFKSIIDGYESAIKSERDRAREKEANRRARLERLEQERREGACDQAPGEGQEQEQKPDVEKTPGRDQVEDKDINPPVLW